ncbi:MAG TPA: helix-turn-helix domain-containing protein [Kiritimatiellia bacterium]|nr:helix-turn-helix domain-containing protein [Kiritimatiellia bacterium]HPS06478.1 helix-turn-helix domain-containing protein [Kiritimatiellia bacterium]
MRYETLKTIAIPYLLAIQDRMTETFGLSVLDERRIKNLILYSLRGPDYSCFSFAEKTATPLHTSAPGKALVANLPEKRRAALLNRMTFERLTPNTITDRKVYEKRLARIRREGYATDIAEELICCHCGGVVIRDPHGNLADALWLSGIDKRLPPKTLLANIRHLQGAAKKIEEALMRCSARECPATPQSPCVALAREFLQKNVCQTVRYADLAKACRVSYSTLRSRFRKETGLSLGSYHTALRIDEATRLLMETRLPVTAIALRLAFYDQKHFSAFFKRKTGLSPLAYRKQKEQNYASASGSTRSN